MDESICQGIISVCNGSLEIIHSLSNMQLTEALVLSFIEDEEDDELYSNAILILGNIQTNLRTLMNLLSTPNESKY